jgi:5'-nucleotidase
MGVGRVAAKGAAFVAAMATLAACNYTANQPSLDGKDVQVTFIHTSDIHSRLIPYRMSVAKTDENLGLDNENGPFGGAARIATIVKRVREQAERSLFVDSGDVFQGAPIFNVFQGEVEMRFLSMVGVDVMSIGNHEFDSGDRNVADKIARFAGFPILSANYTISPGQSATPPALYGLIEQYEVFNLEGLRVGVIGLGNTSTMSSIVESGNALGITPIFSSEITQYYVDLLRRQADVIVVLSHLGLTEDQELIQTTTGIDIVFGGHHHVVLDPPKVLEECQVEKMDETWRERFLQTHACPPPGQRRKVILAHSGAFAKYVGRLDAVFRQVTPHGIDWDVASFKYRVIPVDSTVPGDATVAEMLEPYVDTMKRTMQLDLILGYSPTGAARFGSKGGDSPLGNLVAEAMRTRKGIETDFALTNSLGIRSDLQPGPATMDDMYQVFPFENTITTMYLSGAEVVELFDYVARRSSSRGCQAQAQIAGARVELQCGRCDCDRRPAAWDNAERRATLCDPAYSDGCAVSIRILGADVDLNGQYQLAANDYIAKGGSGFMVLKRNTTQQNSGIPQRNALMDHMRAGLPCGAQSDGTLRACDNDADCAKDYTCGCPERATWNAAAGTCDKPVECPGASGFCVLAGCVNDVATLFARSECAGLGTGASADACACMQFSRAFEQCTETACLDRTNGIEEDGRIAVYPP